MTPEKEADRIMFLIEQAGQNMRVSDYDELLNWLADKIAERIEAREVNEEK